jgi:hypothetical protein
MDTALIIITAAYIAIGVLWNVTVNAITRRENLPVRLSDVLHGIFWPVSMIMILEPWANWRATKNMP